MKTGIGVSNALPSVANQSQRAAHDFALISLMRTGVFESRIAVVRSRQLVMWTREAIAFLDRLQGPRKINRDPA